MQLKTITLALALGCVVQGLWAQNQSLETKDKLPITLLSQKHYSGSAVSTDTITTPVVGDAYTIEVKGKFNSGSGRGLDICVNDATAVGFRVSMDASSLNWTNPVTGSTNLSSTDNTSLRTLRFAVADKKVNIYEDGYYITTRPIETISESLLATADKPDINPTVIPSGTLGSDKPTPAKQGWSFVTSANKAGTLPGNARFETAGTNQPLNNDGSKYTGNFFFIRWDGNNSKNGYYVYPVTLAANTTYTFSMDCAYWANSNANSITVSLTDDKLVGSVLAKHVFGTSSAKKLVPGKFTFTTTHAGTYYLAFSSAWALYAITNLKLVADATGDMTAYTVPSSWETKPTALSEGWALTDGAKVITSWPNARYETSSASSSYAVKNADGTTYDGNIFFVRWDGDGIKSYYYTYPIYLQAGIPYTLSATAASYSNFNYSKGAEKYQGIRLKVVSDSLATSTSIADLSLGTGNNDKVLHTGSKTFTPSANGMYYIAVRGGYGLFALSGLTLTGTTAKAQIVIGKADETEADIDVESATYDGTGAYAPAATSGETTTLNLNDEGEVSKGYLFNSVVNVSGATSLHLTGETPYADTKVNLKGDDAWLYYDYVKPSKVIANYLKDITIDGQAAEAEKNCRITMWANGAVVIPNGQENDKKALVAYDGENFTGNSKEFEIETYHNNLGEWNNKIKSFKLKKGYMATLANNANGTGYSRVFIADDADLEIATMPEGMEGFVSFIRVFRWNWTSKKGKANGYGQKNMLNITCNYDWNVGGVSDDPDVEYTPIRQNLGWPSWTDINNKQGVTHLLGCNEPDRPDQSNCTAAQVIQMWPEMLKSGLRLGSPAPSSVWTWNREFFRLIDKLGYRCDFAVAHIYEQNLNATSLKGRIDALSERGNGRPVWITEWNNGANWTNETWPSGDRNYTPENAEKQRKFFAETLPTLDNYDLIERYFEYDWVQNCRALVLGDTLTLAGKEYGNHKAALAYHHMNRPWEAWKICPPYLVQSIDKDFRNITIKWYDHDGETGKKYTLESKTDNGEWTAIKEFTLGTDYNAGETVTFTEPIACTDSVRYRVKALSYKDTESEYSDIIKFTRDAAAAAPVLKGEALSTSIIKLTWSKVDNAKTYRIERADSKDGDYKVVADNLTDTTYTDDSLKTAMTYYYRAYSLNSSASRPASEVLEMTTKSFTVPSAIEDLRISGGDKSASLRWAFAYDTYYRVSRADSENGEYKVIADTVDATQYVDMSLKNGNTYYYKVQPFNIAGYGPESSIMQTTANAGKFTCLAFDEGEGSKSFDAWGANDGTFCNSAAFTDGRNDGKAVKLTKSSKSYVELPKGAVSRLTDFTIATWINVDGGKGRIFDFGSGTSNWMMLAATSSGVKYKITCTKGTFDFTVPATWTSGEWHHVVLTQNGKDMAIYFDGELKGTATNDAEVYPEDLGETTQNWLGRSQWPSDAYSGHIYDDFRIYDFAATADDVKSLYADKDIVPTENVTIDENTDNEIASAEKANVTLKRTFNANAWNSLVLPFSMTAEQVTSVFGTTAKVAQFTGADQDTDGRYILKFSTADGSIEANKPVLIYGAGTDGSYEISGVSIVEGSPALSNGAFSFVGTYKTMTAKAGDWFISSDNVFYKSRGDETVKATRGVFRAEGSAAKAKGLFASFDGDAPTAINGLSADGIESAEAPMYNLEGQRVGKGYKGIVVRKGQKLIKK